MQAPPQVRFDDGASYETFMGVWSRAIGEQFLHWLAPPPGWRWADVGCGNGAFTELLVERCAPAAVCGIDPSPAQLAFARERFAADVAVRFVEGDAMALPWPDASFDAATTALVIFFVPEPARCVAELARVVRPGGSVSTYAWDIPGGGFPFTLLQDEIARLLGTPPLWPPQVEAARLDALHSAWCDAGLVDVETRVFSAERSYPSFEVWWAIAQTSPRLAPHLAAMAPAQLEELRARLRAGLATDAAGVVTTRARANAVRGRVPVASATPARR
jgi:ubiquinone/menaquinone biosynthesis C-methylase UbiE